MGIDVYLEWPYRWSFGSSAWAREEGARRMGQAESVFRRFLSSLFSSCVVMRSSADKTGCLTGNSCFIYANIVYTIYLFIYFLL